VLHLNVSAVKAAMKRRNWSKVHLAKELGISRMHLDRLLNGQNAPGNKVIAAFLKTFPEYSFEELFFLDNVSPKSDIPDKNSKDEKKKRPTL